jgi:hypothetical protein
MSRYWTLCGILVLAAMQTGCSNMGCRTGCGRTYWGAYAESPPGCEPCDCYGNWTGGCGGCGNACGSPWPWVRAGGLLRGFLGCKSCTEPTCTDTTCEATCAPSCETTCAAEPGCGVGSTGCSSCGNDGYAPSTAPMPMQDPNDQAFSRGTAPMPITASKGRKITQSSYSSGSSGATLKTVRRPVDVSADGPSTACSKCGKVHAH